MRLDKIEIKGFKSFAESTTLYFRKPVTGIVGPNGSGKSNIVDAFRWVLGEQKGKQLRLDQMSDVIFNGSAKRKPSKIAKVELTFSNTKNILPIEYQSVCVSRELDSQGQSTYKINDVTCRLKDIHNLFSDTGIGPDSYAIIALQMVENLLQDRHNDRRKMFEQAAGISKYKLRKKETQSKLKLTDADLDRVDDLLYEIDINLKALEKQARRAKKYRVLKEDYQDISIRIAAHQLAVYDNSLASFSKDLDQYKLALVQLTKERSELDAQIEKDKKILLQSEHTLSDVQRKYNEFLDKLRKLEAQKLQAQNQLQWLEAKNKELKNSATQDAQQIEKYELELVDLESQMTESSTHLLELQAQTSAAQSQLQAKEQELLEHKKNRNLLTPALDRYESQKHKLEKRNAILQNELNRYQDQRQSSDQMVRQLETDLQAKSSELKLLTDAEQQKLSDIQKVQQELQQLEALRKQRRDELTQCEQKLAKTVRRLDARQNEYKLLQSIIDNLEGFPESMKYLKKSGDWDADASLFSDILAVNNEVRTAIEAYLEPVLNHFVVPQASDAYQATRLLQGAQKGRVQIFVLDRIPEPRDIPEIEGMQRAIDLIEVEPRFQRLVYHVLQGVYIAPYETVVRTIPLEGQVFLSQDGRLIQTAQEVKGGSIGLFQGNKIGRKKQLQRITENIAELKLQKEDLEHQQQTIRQLLEDSSLEERQRTLQDLRLKHQEIRGDLRLVNNQVNSQNNRIQEYKASQVQRQSQYQENEKELQEIQSTLDELNQKIQAQRAQISQSDQFLDQNESLLTQLRQDYNQSEIKTIQAKGRMDQLQQDLGFRQKRIHELTTAASNAENSLHENDQQIKTILHQQTSLENELEQAYLLKSKQQSGISKSEEAYQDLRAKIHDKEDKSLVFQKKYFELQSQINQLKEKKTNTSFKINNLKDRLKVEFKVSLSDADINEIDAHEYDSFVAKKDKISNRLENFGEVNPLAIDAYDEMNQRRTHIHSEKQDILDARKDLLQTIQEIDQTAKKRFMESFMAINAHFKTVFRSLFGAEDDCQLLLTDPDDPLESAIEIIAKPKGKRPKSLSQLSGGEKTLTATALLFSLYLLKPAPFCIFDEVDAPLDDVNIQKFNRIIKEFSKESQFVIITHNKQTMVAMDVVYGVFMDQPGVSRVGGVDFTEIDYAQTA